MAAKDEKMKLCHEVFSYTQGYMPHVPHELEQRTVRCTAGSEEPSLITRGDGERERERERDANSRDRHRKYNTVCRHIVLVMLVTTMVLALLWAVYLSLDWYTCTPEQRFAYMRHDLIYRERKARTGGKLLLDPLEEIVNERLLWLRSRDEQYHHNWHMYHRPSHNFTQHKLNETDLYCMLKGMPKGGLLHVHDVGAIRLDFLLQLTHNEDLWTCLGADGYVENFRFSLKQPDSEIPQTPGYPCQWMKMSTFRLQPEAEQKLRHSLELSNQRFKSASQLARHLRRIQRLVYGLVMYRPQYPLFVLTMLEDFYDDGVSYVELRSALLPMYDLSDTTYSILDTANAMYTTANIFGAAHDDFIGLRLIYAPPRSSNNSQLELYMQQGLLLKEQLPGFFIGLDLLSFGDECQQSPLGSQTKLLYIARELDLFLHAGESRCGNATHSSPDLNVIDALLLGSKRIGNPINLLQHPEVMRTMKMLHVAAEFCPLSNYHLQLMEHFEMHPAASLIASGFPLVIGSDYPHLWQAAPLTDDLYITFVGIALGRGNLQLLKQLALNSFLYSAMQEPERRDALALWHSQWNQWMENTVIVSQA